jgi:hypothetical protein
VIGTSPPPPPRRRGSSAWRAGWAPTPAQSRSRQHRRRRVRAELLLYEPRATASAVCSQFLFTWPPAACCMMLRSHRFRTSCRILSTVDVPRRRLWQRWHETRLVAWPSPPRAATRHLTSTSRQEHGAALRDAPGSSQLPRREPLAVLTWLTALGLHRRPPTCLALRQTRCSSSIAAAAWRSVWHRTQGFRWL